MDCECNFESIRGRGLQQIIREMTTHFFEHRIKDAVVEKYIDSDTYRVFSFEDPVTGEIDSVTVTSHGNYSSPPPLPDIQVDGQPGIATPADLQAVMGSIIHTNVTNTGSVTLPYDEVWFFLDGGETLQSMESILGGPGVSTNWYSGETTYLQWQFNTPSDFENMAVSAHGHNIARGLD